MYIYIMFTMCQELLGVFSQISGLKSHNIYGLGAIFIPILQKRELKQMEV